MNSQESVLKLKESRRNTEMNNWLFAICMLGVAIVLSMITTFVKHIFKLLKRRKKEPIWVTVTSAEYIDKDFLEREIRKEKKNCN